MFKTACVFLVCFLTTVDWSAVLVASQEELKQLWNNSSRVARALKPLGSIQDGQEVRIISQNSMSTIVVRYKHLLFRAGIRICGNRHISDRSSPITKIVRADLAGIKQGSGVDSETEKERSYHMGSRKESVS